MRSTIIALMALAALPAAAQAINRCNINGKTVLQQGPCPDQVESVRDSVARKERDAQAARDEAARAAAAEAAEQQRMRSAVAAAEARRQQVCKGKWFQVQIGLTREQLLHCTAYGEPDSINTTTSVAGTREQFVYRRQFPKPHYVYVTNGIVTAHQD